jgi:energy-coupling factor transporter ATP-binding protein EcfA2
MSTELPAWVRELDLALPLSPQILVTGNVRDQYLLPPQEIPGEQPDGVPPAADQYDLVEVIARVCARRGYGAVVVHDVAGGITAEWQKAGGPGAPCAGRMTLRADPMFGDRAALPEGIRGLLGTELDVRGIRGVLTDLVRHRGQPVALIFPYAARLATLARGSPDGVALLTAAEALGHTATRVQGSDASTVYNTVFWIADRQEDLPAAFAVGSQALRIITIPEPAPTTRRAAAEFFIGLLGPGAQPYAEKLASATHGLRVADIDAICRMAADLGTPPSKVDDAARQYRVGVVENPWGTKALTDRIRNAESDLNERVLGQRAAVRKTLDILMRSATNLTGAQSSSSPNRPRGVLFLAGPTGVGKTELAKALAAMVHDDGEARPARFDMSEFGAEHARQRLIGAPPGYVGYDAGGELVNAVRAQPVNVLLFDEIDKAHPLILDLFLQILEDGRLTDGRGATVHFTECLLVFTSNLGVVSRDAQGNELSRLTWRTPPGEVEERLRESFQGFFDETIGRPELRNRFGDNFVAMRFIQPETVPLILDKSLDSVAKRVALVHGDAVLRLSPGARTQLESAACAALDQGGRGINNVVETLLVNPLARKLFQQPDLAGREIVIEEFTRDASGPELRTS